MMNDERSAAHRNTGDLLKETVVNEGRYRHYKGKEYIVLGVSKHSETLEEMVLYRQGYGERGLWCDRRRCSSNLLR